VNDLDDGPRDPADQPIHEVELWDLVSAFNRVMKVKNAAKTTRIRYDDTPIDVHMARIEARIAAEGRLLFTTLFEPGMHRSRMVGLFLALLELVRHRRARCEQVDLFGEIWVLPPEGLQIAGGEERADAA
jgi:segregation and condensation protein A